MIRSLLVAFCVVISFAWATQQAAAQRNFDIARWIENDTAALLTIKDVGKTYEYIKQLPLFSSPSWAEIGKQIVDPEHLLVHPDRLQKVMTAFAEVDGLISGFQRLDFVVHDMDRMQWTLVIESDDSILDELLKQVAIVTSCLLDAEQPIDGELESDLERLQQQVSDRGWGNYTRFDETVFFTNSPDMQFILDADGLEPSLKNALADDRAFRTIQKRSSRLGKQDGQVSVYVKPIRVGRLFPQYTATEWAGYGTDELPAAGLNFVFRPESKNCNQPIVLADATILFTHPKIKRPLLYACYDEVKIPFLSVKPVELFAFKRDEEEFYRESCRCYDLMFGEGAAAKWLANRFVNDDRDFDRDAIPRRESYYDIRFFKEATETGSADSKLQIMRLESIKDAPSMKRYVAGMMDETTKRYGHRVSEHHEDSAQVWRLDDNKISENVGTPEKFAYYLQSDNFTLDSYLVGQDWYVEGAWPESRTQLAQLDGVPDEIDHGEPIRKLIDNLLTRMDDAAPFMIKYYEPECWNPTIEKARGRQRQGGILVANASGGATVFGEQAPGNTQEIRRKIKQQIQARGRRAEIWSTVYKTLADSFGRQLYLYTQDDNEIRVLFGCYPMPKAPE